MARWGNALGGWRKQPRTKGGQFGRKVGGSSSKKKSGNTRRYDAYLEFQKRQRREARKEKAKRAASTAASLAVAGGVLAYKNATPEQRQKAAKTAYNFAKTAAGRKSRPKVRTFQASLNSPVRVDNIAGATNPPKAYSPFSNPTGKDILRAARANRASAARASSLGMSGKDVFRIAKQNKANRAWRDQQGIKPINLKPGSGPQLKMRRLAPGEAGAFRAGQRVKAQKAGQDAIKRGEALMRQYGQRLPKGKQMRPNRRDWSPKIRAKAASNQAIANGRALMAQTAGQQAISGGRSLYTKVSRDRKIAALQARKNAGVRASAMVQSAMNPQRALTAGRNTAASRAATKNMKRLMSQGTNLKSSGNVFSISGPKPKAIKTGTLTVNRTGAAKVVGLGSIKSQLKSGALSGLPQDQQNTVMGMAARIDRVGGMRTRKPKKATNATPGQPAAVKSAPTVASTKPKTSTPKAAKPKSSVPGAPAPMKSAPTVKSVAPQQPKRQLSPEQRQAAAAKAVRPGIAKAASPQNKYQAAEAKAKKELEAMRSELKSLRSVIGGAEVAALALPSPAEEGISGKEKTKRVQAQKAKMASVAKEAKRANELSSMIKKLKYDMGWD